MPVVVNGVREFLKAVDEIDEDMYKNVKDSLKAPMIKVAYKAKQYLPSEQNVLSGWTKSAEPQEGQRRPFPAYDQSTARSGIKYKLGPNKKNRKGYSVYNYVSNESAPGAIYETAGRKNPGGNFSPRLPGSIIGQGKMSGRALFKAYAENEGKAQSAVLKAIEDAYKAFQKKGLVFRKAKR